MDTKIRTSKDLLLRRILIKDAVALISWFLCFKRIGPARARLRNHHEFFFSWSLRRWEGRNKRRGLFLTTHCRQAVSQTSPDPPFHISLKSRDSFLNTIPRLLWSQSFLLFSKPVGILSIACNIHSCKRTIHRCLKNSSHPHWASFGWFLEN